MTRAASIWIVIGLLFLLLALALWSSRTSQAPESVNNHETIGASPGASPRRPIAMVLSCMDYRFVDQVAAVIELVERVKAYDYFILAGASLGFNAGPVEWQKTWMEHIKLAKKLHQISEIIVVEHEDCGYYKAIYNVEKDTMEMHKANVDHFIQQMRHLHPELIYSGFIIRVNGEIIELS